MKFKKVVSYVLIFLMIFSFSNNFAYAEEKNKELVVKGIGIVNVKPDVAILNLGLKTIGKDISNAQMKNIEGIDKIVDTLVKSGINKKDIYTSNFYLHTNYKSYDPKVFKSDDILNYDIYTILSIKTKDIDKVSEFINKATEAGANLNNGVSFTIDNYDKYHEDALKKAIEDADRKAQIISNKLNVSLGSDITIKENQIFNNYSTDSNFPKEKRKSNINPDYVKVTVSIDKIINIK